MVCILNKKALNLLILAVVISFTACTSFQAIDPLTTDIRFELNVGDKVRITTQDGRTLAFKIVSISPDAIHAVNDAISISEIETLEIRYFDTYKTARLIEVIGDVIIIMEAFDGTNVVGVPSC